MTQYLDPKKSKEGKLKLCSKALHPEFSYPLVDVAEMSIEKQYEPLNYLDKDTSVTITYLIEAAQRHLDQLKLGIDINDQEKTLDGKPTKTQPHHAAQVAYNMLMLVLQQKKGIDKDDRLFYMGERLTVSPIKIEAYRSNALDTFYAPVNGTASLDTTGIDYLDGIFDNNPGRTKNE